MLRIAILGNSGSGKSTLARWIGEQTGAPLLDLDTVAWEPHQIAVPRPSELAQRDVDAFCRNSESWVVEGCYAHLIAAALHHTPLLIFLNPGEAACLAHCRARQWEPHKFGSKEEQDKHLPFLLNWVHDYYTRSGDISQQSHSACFNDYEGAKHEVKVSLPYASPTADMMSWLR